MSPRREKISAVDTAWLRMDRPGNLMMICGVLVFDKRVRLPRVARLPRPCAKATGECAVRDRRR